MSLTIERIEAFDVRFRTSRWLDGSDAMNPDPDYSAAYAAVHTSDAALTGWGFTFTIGRGNDLCVAAIRAIAPMLEGRALADICADMGGFWRSLAGDSQLRWLGPEKGVVHLALAAVINAVWDVWAKPIDHRLMSETAHRIARARVGEEGREGVAAFLGKRKPSWSN